MLSSLIDFREHQIFLTTKASKEKKEIWKAGKGLQPSVETECPESETRIGKRENR